MTNYFADLFLAISDRIKEEVPEIKWIDQDFGQLEVFEMRPSVDFPCALIDFPNATYSQLLELGQMGDVTIMVRLGFAPFSTSNSAAPLEVREKAMEYYQIEQKVFQALHGWDTEFTDKLIRMAADTEQRDKDGLRVRILTFTTTYHDLSMVPVKVKRSASLNIQKDIV